MLPSSAMNLLLPPVLARAVPRGVSPTRVQMPGAPGGGESAPVALRGILLPHSQVEAYPRMKRHVATISTVWKGAWCQISRAKRNFPNRLTVSDSWVRDGILDGTRGGVDDEPAALPEPALVDNCQHSNQSGSEGATHDDERPPATEALHNVETEAVMIANASALGATEKPAARRTKYRPAVPVASVSSVSGQANSRSGEDSQS